MMLRRQFFAGVLGAVLVGLAGCGGSGLPPLGQVGGTVTLDGQPLPRGTVQFIPDGSKGTSGPPAVGEIDAQGNFTLKTSGAKGPVPGVLAGWHKVRLDAREQPRDITDTLPKSLIPAKYENPDSSGFSFEVKAGETLNIKLELSSQ